MVESDTPKPRLPDNWGEQEKTVPGDMSQRTGVAFKLHQDIIDLLTSTGVVIISSSFRAKTDESIHAKYGRREYRRIVDIYGARFILADADIDLAAITIANYYSSSEITEFPYIIDYRDPKNKQQWTSPSYKALHIYFPFGEEEFYHIGEAQLLTPEWMKTANRTRRYFERRQLRAKPPQP
ncbi:hypothetical protein HY384_02360 [Candidatus Daviesbacteria bacterium]|nr:hypothetical protein [Candidatus Daviesbacteria bacterium]